MLRPYAQAGPSLLRTAAPSVALCTARLSVASARHASSLGDGFGRRPGSSSSDDADTAIEKSTRRRSRFSELQGSAAPMLTLEHFLLRDKCVKLWRDFLRATRNIPNPLARRETVDWLRDEHFEGPSGLRSLTDVTRIRDGLVVGNVALKRICGPMELAAALNPVHGAFPKLVGRRALTG